MNKNAKEEIRVSKKFKLKTLSALGLLALFALPFIYLQYTIPNKEDLSFKEKFNRDYRIYAINLPENLVFLDEHVPLLQFDIAEKLDRELLVNTYWQSQTLLFLKRSQKWFPIIEPILKREGIPEDFKYLAVIESGLQDIVSPSGAAGFWQIMKATGSEYDLEVNADVDERYHLEKATKVACTYLNEAYQKYGSWALAAASYNMGMNGLDRKLEEQQVNSYFDLHLNSETSRYVYRMMAVKFILENPEDFGFNFREKDLYQMIPTREVMIEASIPNLSSFAIEQGISLRLLKSLNPWLRSDKLLVSANKNYLLKVPKEEYLQQVSYSKPEALPQFSKTE